MTSWCPKALFFFFFLPNFVSQVTGYLTTLKYLRCVTVEIKMLLEFLDHLHHVMAVCFIHIIVQSLPGLRWQQYCSDPVISWLN